jgi:hypothetical protein
MSKKYVFRTELRWSGFKRGSLLCQGKLNVGIIDKESFPGRFYQKKGK